MFWKTDTCQAVAGAPLDNGEGRLAVSNVLSLGEEPSSDRTLTALQLANAVPTEPSGTLTLVPKRWTTFVAPAAPAAPVSPVTPVSPVAPVAPVAPVTPAAPAAPVTRRACRSAHRACRPSRPGPTSPFGLHAGRPVGPT